MSMSDLIADRTDSLLSGRPELPAAGMADAISAGAGIFRAMGLRAVVGVPCNTFHAGPIWKAFTKRLESIKPQPQLINMIDEAIASIRDNFPAGSGVGILSTTGTRKERIYSGPLGDAGFSVIEPDDQEAVHSMIYNPDWGIKASARVSSRAAEEVRTQIDKLSARGAGLVILGCTELPLALETGAVPAVKLLDPMSVLARALVNAADPDKLRIEQH